MPSDPNRPLLRLTPEADRPRPLGRPRPIPQAAAYPRERQTAAFGPKFARLADVLARGANALELRADPTGLAPERLLVFEVRGPVPTFANAIREVAGLELVDEEEMEDDTDEGTPLAYLLVPDVAALRSIESLWRRWQAGAIRRGETAWAKVFDLLRDLRPWGPDDRVQREDRRQLTLTLRDLADDEPVRLEVELVFRTSAAPAADSEGEVRAAVIARGGRIISRARISEIAYHALLVELPGRAVREILERRVDGVAGLEPVMHIRPQSAPTTVEIEDPREADTAPVAAPELGEPILALLDGVPVAAHRLLSAHIDLDDPFGLEPAALVASRSHGTAMASLIVHGDRNLGAAPLPRRIHVMPILGDADAFPQDRLVIDLVHIAVMRIKEQRPGVVIVNLSLGNRNRPFQGQVSPWARLIDRLAHQFGILFVVSAGNRTEELGLAPYATSAAYEAADHQHRATSMITAIHGTMADRRMLSPAETINGITVGAHNEDGVEAADRALARALIDPYPGHQAANPSSALGPGFARSVKPDILMPGAREHMQVVRNDAHIDVRPSRASRGAGLRVAAPPAGGRENLDGYTNGTSAAAALASRTCHRIHDALEAEYGEEFLRLPTTSRAVLLKALLVHPAQWPPETAKLIKETVGPVGAGQASKQKDNIRRFVGFGLVDAEDAVACAADRATFFATGSIGPGRTISVPVPVPIAMSGQAKFHSLSATLAWFTPVASGRLSYRSCRLRILEPADAGTLGISGQSRQPDANQTNRGTVFSRIWSGEEAPVVTQDMTVPLTVQRDNDQGTAVDEAVTFGLAVTLAMPGEIRLYDQVKARVAPATRVGAAPAA